MPDTPRTDDNALIEQAAATMYSVVNPSPPALGWPSAAEAARSSLDLPELREYYLKHARALVDAGLLAVPAPAVDREGLAEQAFQIAYDAVDWNDTIRWVKPGPGEAAWTDVGTLRVQADEIVKQAVDALIDAGLVRAVDTAQDGSEHRG